MAQRISIDFIDDIDGEPASGTTKFMFEGVEYEIDLSEGNLTKMRTALEPYVAAARRVGGKKATTKRRDSSKAEKIREWAHAKGYTVSDRGRIAKDIVAEYEAEMANAA